MIRKTILSLICSSLICNSLIYAKDNTIKRDIIDYSDILTKTEITKVQYVSSISTNIVDNNKTISININDYVSKIERQGELPLGGKREHSGVNNKFQNISSSFTTQPTLLNDLENNKLETLYTVEIKKDVINGVNIVIDGNGKKSQILNLNTIITGISITKDKEKKMCYITDTYEYDKPKTMNMEDLGVVQLFSLKKDIYSFKCESDDILSIDFQSIMPFRYHTAKLFDLKI